MIYWDTSCVLKLYTREPDSDAYLELAGMSDEPRISSEVLAMELYFAMRQKENQGELKKGAADRLFRKFTKDCGDGQWTLIPLGNDVTAHAIEVARTCYAQQPPIPLRTMDGLHLGTALLIKATQLVTNDQRMRAAAAALGLKLAGV